MLTHPFLQELRKKIIAKNDFITSRRIRWIKRNSYYYEQLLKSLRFIIEPGSSVLHIRCSTGYILNGINPKTGVGIDDSTLQVEEAKKNYPHLDFQCQDIEDIRLEQKFDYILVTNVEDIVDIKAVLDGANRCCHEGTRLILVHYNYLWNPLVKLAEKLNMKIPQNFHNWVTINDIKNFIRLSNFDFILDRRFLLFPFNLFILSYLLNRFVARLPFFRIFNLLHISIARPHCASAAPCSVSVVIPCRNEAGNVEDAVKRIPELGNHTEIIFCDDKSTDGTADKVREMIAKYPEKDIKLYNGPGICKSENVWVGFDRAKGDILMILDADLTVIPEELPYFYEAITHRQGEFINGSRLVYPMHDNAMKFFNVIGNKFFSLAFTYILDTEIKDTLCGTKVLWRKDYERIKKLRGIWGIHDRWGDYELLFGAAKLHLKIVDLPVHYYERTYGETKMVGRIKNGVIMLRMCWTALKKIKLY